MKFLEKVALQLTGKHEHFSSIAIVLPNRRAGRVLLECLAQEKRQSIFAPAIFTINDFIEYLSPREKASEEELLKRLYAIYEATPYGSGKSFALFYPWAETFLQDMDEIDRQLVDARSIFTNLSEIKDLEISFAKQELSENQKKYLDFYQNLYTLYKELNRQLAEENRSYPGGMYREVALHIKEYAEKVSFEKIYFVGLGTPTQAEFTIIAHFLSSGKAEIFFDFDSFYANSSHLLIGKIRRNLGERELNWISRDYQTTEKTIQEVAVSGMYSQLYYAIQKIKEIEARDGTLDETALVFADEQMILPFLHAYPCANANFTRGYPLEESAAAQLARHYILLVKNSFRFQEIRKSKDPQYYYRDLAALLENPLLKKKRPAAGKPQNLWKALGNTHKPFYRFKEAKEIAGAVPIPKPEKGSRFLEELVEMFHILMNEQDEGSFFAYSLQVIGQILAEIHDFLKDIYPENLDFGAVDYFFGKKIRLYSIPLHHEERGGLQVMGLLETRALDFKNVIMVAVNEGVIPNVSGNNSLILFDLKRHFHLPLFQETENIFAYHFFRLLQRAEDITLIYNEETSDSFAERSRFIDQLHYEIKAQGFHHIRFQQEHFSLPVSTSRTPPIVIKKDAKIIEILQQKVYSPSQLSKYINCPLQFYFHGVLGLKPPRNISENMEQNVMGTIIHAVMESVVNQIIERPSEKKSILKRSLSALDKMIGEATRNMPELESMDWEKGKAFLYAEIIKKYLHNYLIILEKEEDILEFLSCEKKVETTMYVHGVKIRLQGVMDRIDRKGGGVRILDYKTGKVSKSDVTANNMEEVFTSPDHAKLFQLMGYLYLYLSDLKDRGEAIPENIMVGIISFVQINREKKEELVVPLFKDYEGEEYGTLQLADLFAEGLHKLLQEILDPEKDFAQTSTPDHCRYCDFVSICGRG